MLLLPDAVAAPTEVVVGRVFRRRVLLHPLTIGDLGIYERLGGRYGSLRKHDATLLVWLAARHFLPKLSRRRAGRWLRGKRGARLLEAIVTVNAETFRGGNVADDAGESKERGFVGIIGSLAEAYHWSPEVLAKLTPAQLDAYTLYSSAGGSSTVPFGSREEARRYAAQRKARSVS